MARVGFEQQIMLITIAKLLTNRSRCVRKKISFALIFTIAPTGTKKLFSIMYVFLVYYLLYFIFRYHTISLEMSFIDSRYLNNTVYSKVLKHCHHHRILLFLYRFDRKIFFNFGFAEFVF